MNKEFIYLPLVLVSMLVQGLAQYLPKILNRKKKSLRMDAYAKAANKKSNKMGNMLQIIFIGIGILFSAGLQIY
ncbi:putative inner membrane protein translocase component YidC [Chlamydia abortus]|jgi:putative inner membrane protein translocase component yidC|nr:putative inner membrane protein translocase component YidC [Chlamydia abortus]SGA30841.1 putative inner membrane protein translocase component YidC [Chlamydia abortus]